VAEGPLVHHNAGQLRKVFKGKTAAVRFGVRKLRKFESTLQAIHIRDVEAYGKQFRIRFSDKRTLLVHLMMWGSWRIYQKGERWDKPHRSARVILTTASHEAVAFSAPVVRLLSDAELEGDSHWANLGPDPLRQDFSKREFFRRLNSQPAREIGEVLLDQQIISGVGNILRIEILFGSRIHPHRKVGRLSRDDKERLLRWILKLMRKWLKQMGGSNTWIRIYRKSGDPCPRCGKPIEFFRQGGRITHACPGCQI
jgi:endonuclease-8